MLGKDEKISEGQAGFRPNRSCVDYVYTLGKIIQGRKDAGLTTYCFFLHVQKAYDTVHTWRDAGCGKICGKLGSEERCGENDEKYYGMCEKCCDAGRGNI